MLFQIPQWIDAEARRTIIFLIISGAALAASMFAQGCGLPLDPAWVAIVLCGIPILKEAAVGLVKRFDIKADVLVSLALIASVVIGEIFAAGEIAWIMTIGSLLEELTVEKARAGIAELVELSPETARVVKDAREVVIAADDVAAGDILRVLPGEKIPADGVVLEGATAVDESVMTGESMPVDKTPGEAVMSGTINRFGTFLMRADKVGSESSVKRLIALVESADAGHAKIVRLADRWATWIVVGALLSAAATWFVTGEVVRAVTILVVFCPCALVLATPTAVMAAIGNATRRGFLVRAGDALERLSLVRRAAFDKTGTLTLGKPIVSRVESVEEFDRMEIFSLAASLESLSEHPLGKAIAAGFFDKYGRERIKRVLHFQMIPGKGVTGEVDGRRIVVGTLAFADERAEENDECSALLQKVQKETEAGSTVCFISVDGQLAGFIALQDEMRPFAQGVASALRALGVTPVLLTGDHRAAALHAARLAGIDEVVSDCLPQAKLKYIQDQGRSGQKVLMVGDGVNDAPALKSAHVGLAMGGVGSGIALEAADIVAVSDKIEELPHLIKLSRRMMTVIRINLTLAMTINFIAIILAMGGWMGPVVGALVHNAGSVLVIIHSAWLLRFGKAKAQALEA